jgi:alpha-beta hydrolase superfamily lysophospholipase
LSQPLERICIGVDSTSDPNQPESLPVLKASYESLLSASSPSKKKPVGTGTESTAPVQTSGSNRKDESIPVESVTASTSSAASFQRSLLYFPLPSERLLARESGLSQAVIDVQVTTHDQLTLNGWLILVDRPQAENRQFDAANPAELLAAERPLVIVFPGNGGHRLMRQDLVNALSSIGVDVMLFDYRGYGDNPGAPAEVHLVQDARAIWNCTVRDFGVPARRIFIYGESLGGGVATRLASDLCAVGIQPGGLILQSTFNSVVAVGRYHFPVLPVSTLSVDRFESERHITKVTCPYLHLHGERDTVVPIKLGKKLYRAAPEASSAGIPKQFVSLPGTNHNDVYGSSGKLVLNVLRNFLQLR